MITSKQRAELRGKANELDTTLMVGKEGVTDALLEEADRQLEARELIKGKVLETALMTAREACDAICEALHAEGIQCVGNKFVLWRRSETLAKKTGTAKAKIKVNPVRAGAQKRRAAAKAERERKNEYFKQAAIEQIKQRRRAEQDGEE
ncbi:MAG: YhbY family RNA-binding protein [Oscillospiraceae bacterium]|jgi:Predicted RNA-binding protein containing KH domain, possibly ribosomal protein|nr:YhbY family RNA-binding protein [Oscillospiraceae bacterium]